MTSAARVSRFLEAVVGGPAHLVGHSDAAVVAPVRRAEHQPKE